MMGRTARTGRGSSAVAALLATALAAGCAAPPAPGPVVQDVEPPPGPTTSVSSTVPDAGAATTAWDGLMPLEPRTADVRIETDDRTTRQTTFRLKVAGDGWHQEVAGHRRAHLAREADGSIVTTRIEELTEGVAVEYDPPLATLPASLTPDRPYRGNCRLRVLALASGQVQDQGTCAYVVTLTGPRTVDTPQGPRTAWALVTSMQIHLALSRSEVRTETECVAHIGPVRESTRRVTLALGLLKLQKHQTLTWLPPDHAQ